ncbi:MAG: hypothetical protein EPN43_07280 [Jatrophihabitans sp.]|nr:MAG: hypothetical protein EPN43_07280 [Jatrophihabitans sp.]
MRWDALFDDLAAQAQSLERAERAARIEERTRAEFGDLALLDRVRTAVGARLRVQTSAGGTLGGTLTRWGGDWLLLAEDGGAEVLVALAAVVTIGGLPPAAAVPGTVDAVTARLGLRSVLRRLARDRAPVRLLLAGGASVDAVIDRVGSDFLEAAVVAPGEARRAAAVRGVQIVPTAALAAVRRFA